MRFQFTEHSLVSFQVSFVGSKRAKLCEELFYEKSSHKLPPFCTECFTYFKGMLQIEYSLSSFIGMTFTLYATFYNAVYIWKISFTSEQKKHRDQSDANNL